MFLNSLPPRRCPSSPPTLRPLFTAPRPTQHHTQDGPTPAAGPCGAAGSARAAPGVLASASSQAAFPRIARLVPSRHRAQKQQRAVRSAMLLSRASAVSKSWLLPPLRVLASWPDPRIPTRKGQPPPPSLPCERVQHGCASFNCAASFCGSSTSADVRYARTLTLSDNAHASERVTRSRMLETFQDENLLTPQASHLIPTSRLHSGYIISSHQSDLPVRTHICLASPPTCLLSSLDTLSAFQANPPYPTLQATLHQRTQGYRQICLCAHVSDPPPCLPSHSQSYPEPARTRFPPANDGEIY